MGRVLGGVLLAALASPPARAPLRGVPVAAAEERIVTQPGARFAVELDANATTGFRWRLGRPLDERVVRLRGTAYRVEDAQRTGSGGTEVWTFEAVAPGRTSILFEYVRPWERETPPVRSRTVVVEVARPCRPAAPRRRETP